MISEDTLHPEWIEDVALKNNHADKLLVEKVVRALLLLEGLALSGLPFVFKGGTAVMLMQGRPKRFSIDIDILLSANTDFKKIFSAFLVDKGFSRYEEVLRTPTEIEKYHYKFFYNPVYTKGAREDNILLDIIVEHSPYGKIIPYDIDSPFIKQHGSPVRVNIPSIEDIIGDKLTAFAPHTTGIPYVKNNSSMAMEIIKQLYDIGNLFNETRDMRLVSDTFKKMAQTGMRSRSLRKMKRVCSMILYRPLCASRPGEAAVWGTLMPYKTESDR